MRLMCRVISCSPSGFYRWIKARRGQVPPYERYLLIRILEVFQQSKETYGYRRVFKRLRAISVKCYEKQIAKIMQRNGLKAKTKKKFKVTTDSKRNLKLAPNLLNRNFSSDEMNRVWVGDITYIWTREGWLHLSVVIDLFSRRVVGWSLDKRLNKDLVISSFEQAVKSRRPLPELIFHSDRGAQYASDDFKSALRAIGARQSMSRKGDCWDNAVAESFFKTIKNELIYWHKFKTRNEAELRIFEYIELYYNRHRLHSTTDYMSPDSYECQKVS